MASTTNTNTSLPTNILSQSEPTIDLKVDILDTSSPNDERLKHEDQQNDQKLIEGQIKEAARKSISYEKLKENIILKYEPDYAIMVRTLNFEAGDFDNNLIYIN